MRVQSSGNILPKDDLTKMQKQKSDISSNQKTKQLNSTENISNPAESIIKSKSTEANSKSWDNCVFVLTRILVKSNVFSQILVRFPVNGGARVSGSSSWYRYPLVMTTIAMV